MDREKPITDRLRILIVEDTLSDAELNILRLKKEGFNFDWHRVDTESEFLTMIETPFDLILADWNLPRFSGLRALQIKSERGLDIPFIIVSGGIGEETAVEAMKHGASDYILKDRPERLGQAVRNVLEQHFILEKSKKTEEVLQVSEFRLNALLNHAPVILFSVDREGIIQYAGGSLLAKIGFTPEQLTGKRTTDFFKDRAKIHEAFRSALDGMEISIIGQISEIIMDIRLTPIFNNGRNVTHFIGVAVDITERKQAEEALEKRILALTRPLGQTNDIEFDDLFNLEEIQTLQDQFAQATGVASIITNPNGRPITRPSNFCRLCNKIIRNTKQGLVNCLLSDAFLGRYHPDGPIIQPCLSGGLWDAGASISVGGRHIANWLIGQVRNETQTEEKMRAYAKQIGSEEEGFVEAFREVPAMPQQQFETVAQTLFTLANQLSTSAYQNVQQARFITERKRAETQKDAALEDLEKKMNELERFNALTVNRELRMIELKKEINALLKKSGQSEKYWIAE